MRRNQSIQRSRSPASFGPNGAAPRTKPFAADLAATARNPVQAVRKKIAWMQLSCRPNVCGFASHPLPTNLHVSLRAQMRRSALAAKDVQLGHII